MVSNILDFSPPNVWGDDPIWLALIFFKWVVQPPSRHFLNFLYWRFFLGGRAFKNPMIKRIRIFAQQNPRWTKNPRWQNHQPCLLDPCLFSMAGNATITLFQAHRRDRFYTVVNEHFETRFGGWFAFSRSLGSLFIFRGIGVFLGRGETIPSHMGIETISQHNTLEKEWNKKERVTISIYFLVFGKWILSFLHFEMVIVKSSDFIPLSQGFS